jgi:hypothetical protein
MSREFKKPVDLPDLTAEEIRKVGLFVSKRVRATRGHVEIETDNGTIKDELFATAWADIRPGDRVMSVKAGIRGRDVTAFLYWTNLVREVTVKGTDAVLVYGVAETVRVFIERGMPESELQDDPAGKTAGGEAGHQRPLTAWRRLRAWIRRKREDLSVGIIASVIAGIILAVGAAARAWF